jgi:hypothetical protein
VPLMSRIVGLLVGALLLCGPAAAFAAEPPTFTPPVTVVPSDGLPPQVVDNRSNNNVHAIRYAGRIYMVFRTAKIHIASDDAKLYVVSSRDQVHWRFEGVFAYGRDLREARLLAWRGRLYLYFALLGANPAQFEPGGTLATRQIAPGRWTEPKRILMDDFIPWAVKVHKDVPYMLGYTGGGGTFTPNPPDKKVYWLKTSNGFDWRPVDPQRPIVYTGQCGETDFLFRHDGSFVTACETENDDSLGWGAKVCTAPARHNSQWTCRGDTRRLDSPFVFENGRQVYVIARRQPAFNGEYDLHYDFLPDRNAKFASYDASYAGTPKRCALWGIDTKTRAFDPLMDIPGRGDTCYPAVIPRGRGRYLVYNYTSPLDGPDESWGTALAHGPTLIYRTTLVFPGRSKRG